METSNKSPEERKRIISDFLDGYDILTQCDPRLDGCEPITDPIGLRVLSSREILVSICKNLLGSGGGVPRKHFIVHSDDVSNFVEVWAETPKPLPNEVINNNPECRRKPKSENAPKKGAGANTPLPPHDFIDPDWSNNTGWRSKIPKNIQEEWVNFSDIHRSLISAWVDGL